mgnify:FL=1
MNWKILNISIPVKDIKKSKEFYEMLLGKQADSDDIYRNIFKNKDDYFFGKNGFGLRLFKPKPDLLVDADIQSRRSFVTILVSDIVTITKNLKEKGFKYKFDDDKDYKRLLVQEPSLNLIQFVENDNLLTNGLDGYSFGLEWGIHHMNLESLDVRESVKFFSEIIGFSEGKWIAPEKKGDFSIDPRELSIFPISNDNKGLHIIKPDDGFGYRNSFAHNPSIAGHPAFTVKSLTALIQKLEDKNILFSDAKVYAMPGFHQIYLYDINANMLEINQAV